MTLNLGICGWRFLPHSYAFVNQFQCLELLRHPEIAIFHKDVAFPFSVKPGTGLLPPDYELTLSSLKPFSAATKYDAEYRISWPGDFRHSNTRLVVFMTYEEGQDINRVLGYETFSAAHRNSGAIIVTPSNWSLDGLIRCGGIPSNIFVIPHGIDPQIFKPFSDEKRRELRRSISIENRFVFLSIGAMTENKGIDVLLRAFAVVAQKRAEALLILKGTDALYDSGEALKKQLSKLGLAWLQKRIIYQGGLMPFDQIAALYNVADAYVTPYYSEGFNLPALEAVACGLPIIATGGGATDDFVEETFAWKIKSELKELHRPETSEFFKQLKPDFDHLVALMENMIANREFCSHARKAGPRHLRHRFTWEACVDRLVPLMTT